MAYAQLVRALCIAVDLATINLDPKQKSLDVMSFERFISPVMVEAYMISVA